MFLGFAELGEFLQRVSCFGIRRDVRTPGSFRRFGIVACHGQITAEIINYFRSRMDPGLPGIQRCGATIFIVNLQLFLR